MADPYAIVYLEINLMAALLVGYIRYKTSGLSKMVSQRNFTMAIDAEIVFFLSDTVAVLLIHGVLPFRPVLFMAAKEVYFFSTALMCYFWFIYFECLQDSPFVKSRRKTWLSSLLVWGMAFLLIVNHFQGILFYVDAEGVYHRGRFFSVQYLLSYIYVFFASGHALIGALRRKNLARQKLLVTLALFPVAPAGAGIVQFLYPELPLACATLSFATLVMYLNWLDEMISIDPLTHLNNRKQLTYYYEQWKRQDSSASLYLLLIDANKFKSINDIYGHVQGDAALERIAEALRSACLSLYRRANIARYGGDEFVILVWTNDPAAINDLKSLISRNLERLNREANAPYELTVSIGVAKASLESDLKALIAEADKVLYAEKSKR